MWKRRAIRWRRPVSVAALLAALRDPEALVRSHAADSRRALHGLADGAPPDKLSINVMSDDRQERQKAIAEIKRLLAAHGPLAAEPS